MRPTLIIGIGGTGKWTATHLKQRIIDESEGQLPDNVALLAFDLAAQESPTIEIPYFNFKEAQKQHFSLDFSPNSSEFYNFSEYWAKPIHSVREGREKEFPYISSWLKQDDAEAYRLSREQLNTTGGVGQRRQSSRTSFFLDIANVNTVIRNTLNRLKGSLGSEQLNIFIINSIAGGTGCGTFIDFCYLLHHHTRDLNNIAFYSFIILPKGFENVVSEEEDRRLMEGNCFASFRELHRFMFSTEQKMSYSKGLSDITIPDRVRLLDACYFIDGAQIGGTSGSEVAHYLGLLPALADYIFLHMQESTAPDYAFVFTSMSEELQRTDSTPMQAGIYSTFGIYKLLFDIEGVIHTFAHNLAQKSLEWFVKPSPVTETEIKKEVQDFLKSADNTPMSRNCIAYLLEHPKDLNLTKVAFFSHLRFRSAEEDIELPNLDLTAKDRVPISGFLPWNKIPSEQVDREATRLCNNNLGSEKDKATPDTRVPTYYGVLNYYTKLHDEKFRLILKEKIEQIINLGAGEGALNHARLFLKQLDDAYSIFTSQVNELIDNSDFADRRKRAQENLDECKKDMNIRENSATQRMYLEARQQLLEYEQFELVMTALFEIVETYQTFCKNLTNQIKRWINTFDDGIEQIKKAYTDLIDVRRDKNAIKTREYITLPEDQWEQKLFSLILGEVSPQEGIESELNQRLPHPSFEDIVSTFLWQFGESEDQTDELGCYLPAEFKPWAELRNNPLLWNYNFVNNFLTQGQFENLRNLNIMDILAWQKREADELANDLLRKSSPLSEFDSTAQTRVASEETQAPVPQNWNLTFADWSNIEPGKGLSESLQEAVSSPQTISNPFQIIQYRAMHMIKKDGFPSLSDTEDTYRSRMQALIGGSGSPPLHISPAEKNAAFFEEKMDSVLEERKRCLNLHVVEFLEDEQLVRDLCFAYVYDIISRELVEGKYNFTYEVSLKGEQRRVTLGDNLVSSLRSLYREDQEYKAAREGIHEDVIKIANKKAAHPGDFAEELRAKFNQIELERDSADENDLLRVIKIILWQEASYFRKEANR